MSDNKQNAIGVIEKVSGPLIVASGMASVQMYDVVRVSEQRLIGEVIELRGDLASIQVYEETAGLGPGEPVYATGEPLSVELAPVLLGGIFDGIQRPLDKIAEASGDRIARGIDLPKLDREKKWKFEPVAKVGDVVITGDILGSVAETPAISQKILVPNGVSGTVEWLFSGECTIEDAVAKIKLEDGSVREVTMIRRWPVRRGRPYREKMSPNFPMITGQRSIDTLFPIAMGGVAAIPGPFGSGKTVVQHQLAKWSDADLIVYIGCGERGNEMTDVLMEFPELNDPRTGLPLMNRTVLIANTSDMPVAAREASIYTGITIAEYYRDMGYKVAIMADSTSRWAEALREMSGRLEEMPGEEGYPAYLSSRLAEFYERAGIVKCLGSDTERVGAISAIGAVSPPGGDTSEPVSQATLRIVKVFWGLSSNLAYRRHFPAIDWLTSYSLYRETVGEWYDQNINPLWTKHAAEALAILQQEAELDEIVQLVGIDALSYSDRLALDCARSIREDYLQQDSFHETDAYADSHKQFAMLAIILKWYERAKTTLAAGVNYSAISSMKSLEKIGRMKFTPGDKFQDHIKQLNRELDAEFAAISETEDDQYA